MGRKILKNSLISIKFLPGAGPIVKAIDIAPKMLIKTLVKADKIFASFNHRTKKKKKYIKTILSKLQKIEKIF